ncbi:protein ALP1-like [Pararge aegeria]|nr:protein ALP1-like [Pararge aegeria]XP_039747723.1 protein ALP1-like [Pararge aegeria]XP_039748613.1 protein ALP1-like [Pararge aegeria]XP_039749814.1 protein ALP1-like [Pararge aegeria]XP_039750267.1 protein ALP1-like [Pararge aegeria]XP_039750703.1 protein ALP1-like [Pararge aegeria]XP_039752575.1 protein ALP1-like [Pararge aegeria]XP_039756416.1 protein ALP1-like [Pararge aegeria]XP_039757594.1 protein ALP1-like [Pararge aegeria]XP_039760647.1 protein ALP1-like [Pararge aegeria]XP_03
MDSVEATLVTLSLVLLLRKQPKRRQRKQRQYWMHPFNKERLLSGHHVTTFKILKSYDLKFRSCYRMSYSTFCELLSIVKPELTRRNTVMRQCISAEERLTITLRYLATGCNFTDLHLDFKCGHTTARTIVKETVEVIWKKVKDISMPEPTEELHLETAEGFMKHANFPNLIGAIDGKHIRIIKPCHTGSEYYNYKHFFSIVLLAICDANYNFIDIDVGCYGKSSDSTIHDSSEWVKKLRQGNYNLPQPRPISNNGIPIPFSFIGDEGFALSQHLQRPYAGKHLPRKKRIYNYRLTRARRYIECTFGILSNKFKIFNRPINVNVDFATNIVKACCVLHNFIRKRDGYKFDHTLSIVGFQDPPASDNLLLIGRRRSELSGTAIRNIYTDYFTGVGSVPWQDSKI